MGNPNYRRQSESIASGHASPASGKASSIAPAASQTLATPAPVTPPNKMHRYTGNKVAVADGSPSEFLHAPRPKKQSLAFKSFKNGDILTNSFLPTSACDLIQPFPPAPHTLSPTASEFVPSASGSPCIPGRVKRPNHFLTTSTGAVAYSSNSSLDSMQDMLNAINQTPPHQLIPSKVPTPGAPRYTYPRHALAETKAISSGQSIDTTMQTVLPTPPPTQQRPSTQPLIFYTRKDKARKDILIDQNGIHRNLLVGKQTYLENGDPIQTFNEDDTDFLIELKNMPQQERFDFLRKNMVEILVVMQSAEEEEASLLALSAEKKEAANSKKEQKLKDLPAIIEVLRSLPSYIMDSIQKLTITLQFSALSSTDAQNKVYLPKAIAELFDPARTVHGKVPNSFTPDTIYQESPNFKTVGLLVEEIFKNKRLKALHVVLASPTNMRTTLTLNQLNCVLPFYDLDFTDWKLFWTHSYMSQPERLRGWPLEYMNRERNKICREREKKLEEMVFVRKSDAPTLDISPVETKKIRFTPPAATPHASSANKTAALKEDVTFVTESTGRTIDIFSDATRDNKRRKI